MAGLPAIQGHPAFRTGLHVLPFPFCAGRCRRREWRRRRRRSLLQRFGLVRHLKCFPACRAINELSGPGLVDRDALTARSTRKADVHADAFRCRASYRRAGCGGNDVEPPTRHGCSRLLCQQISPVKAMLTLSHSPLVLAITALPSLGQSAHSKYAKQHSSTKFTTHLDFLYIC
jgi:hypothetical protein